MIPLSASHKGNQAEFVLPELTCLNWHVFEPCQCVSIRQNFCFLRGQLYPNTPLHSYVKSYLDRSSLWPMWLVLHCCDLGEQTNALKTPSQSLGVHTQKQTCIMWLSCAHYLRNHLTLPLWLYCLTFPRREHDVSNVFRDSPCFILWVLLVATFWVWGFPGCGLNCFLLLLPEFPCAYGYCDLCSWSSTPLTRSSSPKSGCVLRCVIDVQICCLIACDVFFPESFISIHRNVMQKQTSTFIFSCVLPVWGLLFVRKIFQRSNTQKNEDLCALTNIPFDSQFA